MTIVEHEMHLLTISLLHTVNKIEQQKLFQDTHQSHLLSNYLIHNCNQTTHNQSAIVKQKLFQIQINPDLVQDLYLDERNIFSNDRCCIGPIWSRKWLIMKQKLI